MSEENVELIVCYKKKTQEGEGDAALPSNMKCRDKKDW